MKSYSVISFRDDTKTLTCEEVLKVLEKGSSFTFEVFEVKSWSCVPYGRQSFLIIADYKIIRKKVEADKLAKMQQELSAHIESLKKFGECYCYLHFNNVLSFEADKQNLNLKLSNFLARIVSVEPMVVHIVVLQNEDKLSGYILSQKRKVNSDYVKKTFINAKIHLQEEDVQVMKF